MPSAESPPTRTPAVVVALQWGLVAAFVFDTVGRFIRNYYRATSDSLFAPEWVSLVQLASLPVLLVGAILGYWWVVSGRGDPTTAAHRARVRFVGALVAGWGLAIVPTLAFEWLLGDALFSVPFFVLPTLAAVAALSGALLLAYRVEPAWYERNRSRLLGAVQGAFAGLVLGVIGFVAYGSYLSATRSNFDLNGGPGIVVLVCLGALAGALVGDRPDAGDRAAEFATLLVLSTFALTIISAGAFLTVGTLGLGHPANSFLFYPVAPLLAALALAVYLTYRVRTNVYARLVGRSQ